MGAGRKQLRYTFYVSALVHLLVVSSVDHSRRRSVRGVHPLPAVLSRRYNMKLQLNSPAFGLLFAVSPTPRTVGCPPPPPFHADRGISSSRGTSTSYDKHRHYGALQGRNKATLEEAMGEVVVEWRRAYGVRPPPMTDTHPHWPLISLDSRYRGLKVPQSESLRDTANRVRESDHSEGGRRRH